MDAIPPIGKICSFSNIVVTFEPTRSSESDGRSNVSDSLECPDKFRVPR